jgi:hypothetical protein
MADISVIPEWLGKAVVGAVIAALGYVSKLIFELVQSWKRNRAEEVTRLLSLASLLKSSRSVFGSQRQLVVRLTRLIDERLPTFAQSGQGYEKQLTEAFPLLTKEELEIHGLIRSFTEHGLRPLNASMSEWLDSDIVYRNSRNTGTPRGQLAAMLNQLDAHLRLWHAKYAAWIPNYPEHALVYLADEEAHGLAFPHGLDAMVENVLETMGTSFSTVVKKQDESFTGK